MKKFTNTRNYSSRFIAIGVTLIIVFGLLLGYLSAQLFNNYNNIKESKKEEEIQKLAKVSSSEILLSEGALVIYNRVYLLCNEMISEQKSADETIIGKNKNELSEIFNEWNIVEFNTNQLLLEKSINSYSPQYYKISVYKNDDIPMVAVYTYDIEGNEMIDSITDMPIDLVDDEEKAKIQKGIYVKGKEDLYDMLENYDE